jgi:hypothetical protein
VRQAKGVLAVFALLVLSAPVSAQQSRPSAFSPIRPSDIRFTPIDMSNVVVQPTVAPVATPSSSLTRFMPSLSSFANFFSRSRYVNNQRTIGVSNLPAPSSFPSSSYGSPLQPRLPFTPGQ